MNKKTGRRSSLTKELQNKICNHIEKGLNIKDACLLCDVSQATYYNWITAGEKFLNDIENGDFGHDEDIIKNNDNYKYLEFLESTTKARIKNKQWHIENIHKGAEKDEAYSKWYLKNVFRDEFCEKQHTENKTEMTLIDQFKAMTNEELEKTKEQYGKDE